METEVYRDRAKTAALFTLDAAEVRSGQRWRHLRSGRSYTVIATGLEEATLEPVVIYAGGDGVVWTRPLSSFIGNGTDGRPRFLLQENDV